MPRERPQVVIVKSGGHTGLIGCLLLVFVFPIGVLYTVVLFTKWAILTAIDWLTAGPIRRLRR